MSPVELSTPVGEIVARYPGTSRIFDRAGIDFGCGGRETLADACRAQGLPADRLLAELEEALAAGSEEPAEEPATALAEAPLEALCRYVAERFHVPLREELPRLGRMSERVLEVHGRAHAEVVPELARLFRRLRSTLEEHMAQEEALLFPAVEALGRGAPGDSPPGLAALVGSLAAEHDAAGAALARLQVLTAGFTPPPGACNTFRALYDGLAHLERDLRLHVELENGILYPRAVARARELGAGCTTA